MVKNPRDYPWSSFHYNALGKEDKLLTPHWIYKNLGSDSTQRQANYYALFDHHIPKQTLEEIRSATNKAWVLGNERFKDKIEKLIERQVQPKARGGDKRSQKYKDSIDINRV